MTYNEWRDELKSNLLCVSEQERDKVLDYYAEAYADRRDAGYSEQEITAEFGAPYDAAKRILSESEDESFDDINTIDADAKPIVNTKMLPNTDIRQPSNAVPNNGGVQITPNPAIEKPKRTQQKSNNSALIFVLICVIFAIPIFAVFMALVGITIGICATVIALPVGGVAMIGAGVVALFSDAISGVVAIGFGLAIVGVSLIIIPVFIKLVKLMWKLLGKLFSWLKSQLGGKERQQ